MSPSTSAVSIGGNSVVPRSFLPRSRYTGPAPAAPRNIPFASTQPPSTSNEPLDTNTGRGAQRATSSCESTGRSLAVRGPAYLRKLPATQWYAPLPAAFSPRPPEGGHGDF